MRAQAERYRAAWRLAWDFPEPDPEAAAQPLETVADRWLAELDRYGIDRIGFATGGGNDTLARAVARHPDRFIGFAHHNPGLPDAVDKFIYAIEELGLKGYKMMGPRVEIDWTDPALIPTLCDGEGRIADVELTSEGVALVETEGEGFLADGVAVRF